MIKELVKLANHLDNKGLAKEADYLDNIIKKMAQDEELDFEFLPSKPKLIEEEYGNPGNMLEHQEALETKDRMGRRRETGIKELKKTLEWFEEVVFPAVREDNWPVVADDNYHTDFITAGISEEYPDAVDNYSHIIRKGSKFGSSDGKPTNPNGLDSFQDLSLAGFYKNLEREVIENNLPIPMESAQPLK